MRKPLLVKEILSNANNSLTLSWYSSIFSFENFSSNGLKISLIVLDRLQLLGP
ncbi:hypothetical protein [Spiroplasma endosymbiont of Poecilobothrus nobilitatus]|uniref:hypothetical protein n=1 Tax=Spiroplasma endosymbiont of Poecilobothrus nobilitatus TaxID=1209220 RepID=UPI00313B430E